MTRHWLKMPTGSLCGSRMRVARVVGDLLDILVFDLSSGEQKDEPLLEATSLLGTHRCKSWESAACYAGDLLFGEYSGLGAIALRPPTTDAADETAMSTSSRPSARTVRSTT